MHLLTSPTLTFFLEPRIRNSSSSCRYHLWTSFRVRHRCSRVKSYIKAGVQCRRLINPPRLHAKVYIFGSEVAVVTSANLTTKGLDDNIEVGVQVSGNGVQDLSIWFDQHWSNAHPINLGQVSKWEKETAAARRDYLALRKRVREKRSLPKESLVSSGSRQKVRDILHTATQFFICNTNRRWSTGVERLMRQRKYAAAWEDFNYPTHMQRVKKGDVIFMYAKGVGIIGVGHAKAKCEIREPSHPDRIRKPSEYDAPEWRVPVDEWLAWVDDDADAFPYKIPNVSFIDVSGDSYREFRKSAASHFING